jgi:hypothetical protein
MQRRVTGVIPTFWRNTEPSVSWTGGLESGVYDVGMGSNGWEWAKGVVSQWSGSEGGLHILAARVRDYVKIETK